MKAILATVLVLLSAGVSVAKPTITLTHLRGNVYVVQEDYPLSDENAAVYVGKQYVTVIGATFSPDSARRLVSEIAKVNSKPIGEVVDTNDNLDRAGGNSYFKGIGARIISTDLTRDLMQRDWDKMVSDARKRYPDYPNDPVTLPDTTYPGDFELQGGANPGHLPGLVTRTRRYFCLLSAGAGSLRRLCSQGRARQFGIGGS